MWIHIVIFMVILGAFLAGKLGRLPPWAGNAEGQKLFILVALAGNIIGMLLTVQSGGGTVYSSGYRMEKEETGAYEEKFIVSVHSAEQRKYDAGGHRYSAAFYSLFHTESIEHEHDAGYRGSCRRLCILNYYICVHAEYGNKAYGKSQSRDKLPALKQYPGHRRE